MTALVYTAAEAATVAKCGRATVDAACASGALAASDLKPESTKRSWRILADDLTDWVRAGMPTTKAA